MTSELSQSHNIRSDYFGDTEVVLRTRHGVERLCERCGQPFQTWCKRLSDPTRGRFCSRSCSSSHAALCAIQAGCTGPDNHNWKGGVAKHHYRYTSRFRQRFPERHKAQEAVRRAVESGRLTRPAACEACLVTCKPHGHHDDYATPLAVRWLCRSCHNAADRARRDAEAVDKLRHAARLRRAS